MNNDYICNDRPIEASEQIKKLTDEELEREFEKRFGKYNQD